MSVSTPDPRGTRRADAPTAAPGEFGEKRVVPVTPLTPEAQRRRRRLVRILAGVTFVLGAALSAIPTASPSVTSTEHIESGVLTRTMIMSGNHIHGFPFATVTARARPGGGFESISVHPMGFFGNFAVAVGAILGLSMLFGRRRRDEETMR